MKHKTIKAVQATVAKQHAHHTPILLPDAGDHATSHNAIDPRQTALDPWQTAPPPPPPTAPPIWKQVVVQEPARPASGG